MKLFERILRFFCLADREGNLSITNIAVIVLITKIAMAKTLDWQTASGLLIALLNYSHKRYQNSQTQPSIDPSAATAKIQDLESKIETVASKLKS